MSTHKSDVVELKGCIGFGFATLGVVLVLCSGILSFGDRGPTNRKLDPKMVEDFRRHDMCMSSILGVGLVTFAIGTIMLSKRFRQ